MGVTERDRAFLARLGAYKAASHAEALAQHLALDLDERLQRSWELYLVGRDEARPAREDDPSPLYERARARGLCA